MTLFTFFQTEYGTPSGPGAGEGENLARAAVIFSLVRWSAEEWRWRRPRRWSSGFAGKKWSRRALLISTGELASGRSGKRETLQGVTNFFVVQILCGVVLARKSDQWDFLAFLTALKYPTQLLGVFSFCFFFLFFFFFYIMCFVLFIV